MTHRLSAATALLIGTLALAGCGGGGGGGPTQPITNTSPIRDAIGGGPLNLSGAQIRSEIRAVESHADRLNITNVLLAAQYGYLSNCSGTSCRVSGVDYYLSDLRMSEANYDPIMTRRGFNVVQGINRVSIGGEETEYETYGGWGDHSMFFAFQEDDIVFAATAGNATGSRPVGGSATWRGVMVGGDFGRVEGFQGDATITADFEASNVDVAFTNIHEFMTGGRRNDISFNNVPFTADGFASGSRTSGGNYIDGTFYGPNHAEAGGVFETDNGNRFGSFGARRQD
ncbi:MAG: hypothetical protein OXE84_02850 [Rhodobacteraceae bacterium]|nr:hypothetical protein [Paracoccaceae bacterium]MCY4326888.1 hypothetical protein [Paracoccaceae bacterium]